MKWILIGWSFDAAIPAESRIEWQDRRNWKKEYDELRWRLLDDVFFKFLPEAQLDMKWQDCDADAAAHKTGDGNPQRGKGN